MGLIRTGGLFLLFPILAFSAPAYKTYPLSFGSPVNDGTNMARVELAAKKSRNIVQLLSQLPVEFRSRSVFMFESKSLHYASPEEPRILLSNLDASFILAFPLDPDAKSAEMVQASGSSFLFKEIAFRPDGEAQISIANSPKCLECHQSPHRANVDPRPNWEPYPRWGGALGQEDKFFTDAEKNPMPEQDRLVAKIQGWQRGTDNPLIKLLDLNGVIKLNKEGIPQTLGPLVLTHKLAQLNFKRVARLITSTPVYKLYRKEIVECIIVPGSGENVALNIMPKELSEFLRGFDFSYLSARLHHGIHGCLTRIFAPHGIDTTDWSMVFRPAEVRFDQFSTPIGSDQELYSALRELDPSLPRWTKTSGRPLVGSSLNIHDGKKLLEETRPQYEKMANGETLLNRCNHCHTSSVFRAPYIDFSPQNLKASPKLVNEIMYRISTDGTDQMPPRNHLKENEVSHLVRYLKNYL